jgi:hypothetical protein
MVCLMSALDRPRYAIATASYRGDLERCRLLCASIDRFVSELSMHYILVEDADLALFAPLSGPRRRIVPESALFPRWLKAYPDLLSGRRRRVWTGMGALARGVPPLRGWHTQQLRKLALPHVVAEDIILVADSDAIFLKPFALSSQLIGGLPRLFMKPGGITASMTEHAGWVRTAARLLGRPAPAFPADDFINNMPTWRRSNLVALWRHIENVSGRDWFSAVARERAFSEMLIYGQFCSEVLGSDAGHVASPQELTRTFWSKEDVGPLGVTLAGGLTAPSHVSIGVQSFLNVPMDALWRLFREAAAQP